MIGPIARTEPEKAEKLMTDGQAYLKALGEKAKEKATEAAIQSGLGPPGPVREYD